MHEPTETDLRYVEIVLADAGISATADELRQFAMDRAHVRSTMDRLYAAPYDDLYAPPRPRPDYVTAEER